MPAIETVDDAMREVRAGYSAASPSRFNRVRTGLGGTADGHIAGGMSYWRVREICRDMDRNDNVIGQMIDRAVDNVIGEIRPIPSTGSKERDAAISERWRRWSTRRGLCDVSKRFTFLDMCRLLMRHQLVDGDVFAMPVEGGRVQLLEGDWVSTPIQSKQTIIHGIEIDQHGAPKNYWIAPPDENNWQRPGMLSQASTHTSRPAFSDTGEPLVWHMAHVKRISQHRGMPALTPVVETAGQFDDLNFAKLIQQQVSACVAAFIERQQDFSLGRRSTVTTDGVQETLEKVAPGMIVRLKPGEKISAFAPNVTPAEWFSHIKLLLRIIGANLGLPISLVLLDTSDTNFHGYRGELNQAQLGFKKLQRLLREQFLVPLYEFLVRTWAVEERWPDPDNVLTSHRWSMPGWTYIDPMVDAKADAFAMENLLSSPRDVQSERGRDWEDTVAETVEDRALAISAAQNKAAELSASLGIELGWRDVLNLAQPKGNNVTQTTSRQVIEEAQQ